MQKKIFWRTSSCHKKILPDWCTCGDEKNAADHSFHKVELSHQIHDKAVALGEDRIVALLSKGDHVAIEAKYCGNCYTGFNRHYNVICKRDTAIRDTEFSSFNQRLLEDHISCISITRRGSTYITYGSIHSQKRHFESQHSIQEWLIDTWHISLQDQNHHPKKRMLRRCSLWVRWPC